MASAFSHGVAALGIGACFYRSGTPKRVWVAGTFCSVIPDFDVIGFRFGIHYGDFWGHRGFTHSLLFAGLVSGIAAALLLRRGMTAMRDFALFAYLFLATASHGVLDAMMDERSESRFAPHSLAPVISCPGDPFVFRRYRLRASSPIEGISCCEVNWCGFGFRHFYLRP